MGCQCEKEKPEELDLFPQDESFSEVSPNMIGPLSTFRNCIPMSQDLADRLENKFSKKSLYGEKIFFQEIIPDEFIEVLESNPANLNKIFRTIAPEITEIYDNSESTFRNISPIKVVEPSGEVQYYQGSYDIQGQCCGRGIWTKDNNLYYGNFKNDNFSGKGVFITERGDYIIGNWENGKLNGEGKLVDNNGEVCYEGGFKDNKKNGEGDEFYPGGDVYSGYFYNGLKNGKGIYSFANGSTYEGNFKDNKFNGFGEFKSDNGDNFTGEFKNGKIDGHGNFEFADGTKFEGDFAKGGKMGQGEYVWTNGSSYKGQFNGNRLVGTGTLNERGYITNIQVTS